MAKIVKETEPYIMTDNKKRQIARFKEMVARVGKNDSIHKRNAREILGLEAAKPD